MNEFSIIYPDDFDGTLFKTRPKLMLLNYWKFHASEFEDVRHRASIFEEVQERRGVFFFDCDKGFVLDREKNFLNNSVSWIVKYFPGLKIVINGLSTEYGVDFIKDQHANIGATISLHHLLFTLNDCIEKKFLEMPICQSPKDRYALFCAAFYYNSNKFFFGSRFPLTMESDIIMPLLCSTLFYQQEGNVQALERFTSLNGAKFLGLPINEKRMTFKKLEKPIPNKFFGKDIEWAVN